MTKTPLFIPLAARWFDEFEQGRKTCELRRYGPRWNERTCPEGRAVILSRGYGKARRLRGVISCFRRVHAYDLERAGQAAVLETYGTLVLEVAVIGVADLRPVEPES